jgi:hypothetical protein
MSDLVGCGCGLWKPAADSNGRLAHFLKIEVRQTAILVCSELPNAIHHVQIQKNCAPNDHYWLVYPTGWAAQPFENISQGFFKGQRNPLRHNTALISDINMKGLKRQ